MRIGATASADIVLFSPYEYRTSTFAAVTDSVKRLGDTTNCGGQNQRAHHKGHRGSIKSWRKTLHCRGAEKSRATEKPKIAKKVELLHGRVVIGVARVDRLAACEAFTLTMIEANAVLAEFPAEVHLFAVDSGRKIKQADFQVFHDATSRLNPLKPFAKGVLDAVAFNAQLGSIFIANEKAA